MPQLGTYGSVGALGGNPQSDLAWAPSDATDPDLARVVNAWPDLPAHVGLAVLALVGTAAKERAPGRMNTPKQAERQLA